MKIIYVLYGEETQLVEHCTGIAKVTSSNPVQAWIFFPGLISTTSSVVFIAARISFILFFTAVYIYDFLISTITIHHLDGLFGPNIMTSSQLAC